MEIVADRKWGIYRIVLIIQALFSLHAWFLWSIPEIPALLFLFVVNSCFFLICPFWLTSDRRVLVAILILVFEFYLFRGGNFNGYLYGFLNAFALIPIVLLKPYYQKDLLNNFQKVLAIILAISLLFWLLYLIGVPLPFSQIEFGESERAGETGAAYYFNNYYVFLVDTTFSSVFDVIGRFRFRSVFLEPGFLAILMVFFLFINKFNFKEKKNLVFLLTLIATISLAGFILGIFSYIASSAQNTRKSVQNLLIFSVALFVGYQFFTQYNGGDNVVNIGIIERLEYDQEKTIAGNNRTSEELDDQYSAFLTSSKVFFGIGREGKLEFGVGYKAFIIKHGIMGLILFVLMLYRMVCIKKSYRAFILFVLYIFMFARGNAVIMYPAFILTYVCGIIVSEKSKNILNEKNRNHIPLQRV